ncbi:MAG TPA: helix-turn-helix transcriptional regulator [Kofleriaceae bacterium]|nr:helix-turn-helix transcriptional regulator [Kofleriaceae bacterium]
MDRRRGLAIWPAECETNSGALNQDIHLADPYLIHRRTSQHGDVPREHEIASLVGNGLRNQDIARLLGTSPHTVHNQLATIFRKLTLSGRAELAALYARTMR